ncbi:MAG: B12-binding domain-containing radical SAM protein [Spirochaetaceae bacterium]|jgi:radical SAM superfamily enzyme YgiQ (UPF0313 family)|nr:B12-binding domain-containing radical SAM protein [Spirochaetaceae bacterium]
MADIVLAAINAKWIHPSLALRLLKANLGPLEDRCQILEFALRQPLPEKTVPILAARPRILGLSVSIWNHLATLELLDALDAAWTEAPRSCGGRPLIILGGPEVSYLPPEAEIIKRADWVVQGEGEAVFRELCMRFLEDSPSDAVGRSDRGAIRELSSAASIQGAVISAKPVDPAALVPAYRLYSGEDLCRKLVYVEASRGCPFGCEFCLSSLDKAVREFPLEPFLEEMDRLIRRGARTFKFLDRTFNLDIERAGRIMEFFLTRLAEAPSLCVHFEMVPSRFPPELRKPLVRFPPGSLRLEVGIQTFNRETAALIGRPCDPEAELEALRFLGSNAIVHADLIAGLPGEGLASFGEGFDRLWTAGPGEIQAGVLKRLPGTPLARRGEAWGMRFSPDPPYEVLETAALSAPELDRIKNFARFWERIVNRGVFQDLGPRLFPKGQPVFQSFLERSDRLLTRFGRNWGIDRRELRAELENQ